MTHVRPAAPLVAAAAAVLLAACGGTAGSSVPPPVPTATPAIAHIVIIVQENRTIDNLFNGFPGADTVQSGATSTGKIVPLVPVSLSVPYDIGHSHGAFLASYNGGRMNGFDLEGSYGKVPPLPAYGYVTPSHAKPYWDLAQRFTLADRMFQSNSGPSYPAHQYLIAGQSANVDENPKLAQGGSLAQDDAWGCDSPAGSTTWLLGPSGGNLPGPFPCFDYQTLGDAFDHAGISWAYYAPQFGSKLQGFRWSAFDAIKHIRYGPDWHRNVISPEATILQDIGAGRLPAVSWVTPNNRTSDHAGETDGSGPNWVASITNAIGASQYWKNTAIFVVWDDWGGWYDHVPPAQLDPMGLGFRVPLVIVSPFAKHGYVSHTQHEFGSILRFVEQRFGLPPLAASDARADDLRDCFDFTQHVQTYVPVSLSSIRPTRVVPIPGLPPED